MKINKDFLKNSLIKDTFVYTLTDTLSKAVTFFLLPFVSKYITPDELGMATNFAVFSSIVSLMSGIAIVNAIPYLYYEQSKADNAKMMTCLLFFSIIICSIVALCIFLFNNAIYNYLGIEKKVQLLAVPYIVLSTACSINLIRLRLEDKAKLFALIQIARILLNLIIVVLLVIILKLGGLGKICADVSVIMLMSVIHLSMLFKNEYITAVKDIGYVKKLLKFGLPLMPHSLSSWLKDGLDKVFITSFSGLYQNGLYSMAISISQIYKLFNNAFLNAYTPYLQKRLTGITKDNELTEKLKIVKLTYLVWGCFFIISLLTIGATWFIIKFIIDDKYLGAFVFVPWLILGYYIYAVYSLTIQFIYKMKKTVELGILTFTGSIIQMILGYFFIKNMGAIGAAYSSALGAFIISSCIFFYSNRVYKLPWFYFLRK